MPDRLSDWATHYLLWINRMNKTTINLIKENDMEDEIIEFEEMIIMEDEDGVETVEFLSDVLEEAE